MSNMTNEIRLGLNSICNLCDKLGNPQDKLRFIHITGTNGKGSTGAFIATILKEAGYRVGHYSSPAVFSREEIIKVNGRSISKRNYDNIMENINALSVELSEEGMDAPTEFEKETALAFEYFLNNDCDLVVLEVGMGGATDATNIIKNTLVSVFTPISVDHVDYLGKTIEDIAKVKAGIIKPNGAVVSAPQEDAVIKILCAEAKKLNANEPMVVIPKSFKRGLLGLSGIAQNINASVAVATIKELCKLDYSISEKAIENGLKNTSLPGRFEKISSRPIIIIDGGHNLSAAISIKENLLKLYPERNVIMICGMLVNKDHNAYLSELAPLAGSILTVSTSGSRAYSAEDLARDAMQFSSKVSAIGGVEEAVDIARMMADTKDIILICGSFTILKPALKYIEAH